MKATEQILRYFEAVPGGTQRVKSNHLHEELLKSGSTGENHRKRVISWAEASGLDVTSIEGEMEGNPDYYTFKKKESG